MSLSLLNSYPFVLAIFGILLLIAAFIKPLRALHSIILSKLIIITPVIAGLIFGAGVGLVISFGSCYKQACSQAEEWAVLIMLLLSLVVSLPIATVIFKKRSIIEQRILQTDTLTWVVVGFAIFLLAIKLILHKI